VEAIKTIFIKIMVCPTEIIRSVRPRTDADRRYPLQFQVNALPDSTLKNSDSGGRDLGAHGRDVLRLRSGGAQS
jgi:hypothetical protein